MTHLHPSDTVLHNIGKARGCIPPYPCGRGAGTHGDDLPCDCEAIANGEPPHERVRYLSPADAHGASVTLSAGQEYVIDRSAENGVWVLWNAYGTPIGYLESKPPEGDA